ncbi:hypothetical protein BVRB_5g120490 isoform A [Beta vulgaris subsp. vulgaris]|nr:hypothetical protein BVRB_5g120490 isoform A [Beta vulgaris subsp. vulgaris]
MVKFSKQGNSVGARVSETGGVDLVSDMAFDTCMMKTEEEESGGTSIGY